MKNNPFKKAQGGDVAKPSDSNPPKANAFQPKATSQAAATPTASPSEASKSQSDSGRGVNPFAANTGVAKPTSSDSRDAVSTGAAKPHGTDSSGGAGASTNAGLGRKTHSDGSAAIDRIGSILDAVEEAGGGGAAELDEAYRRMSQFDDMTMPDKPKRQLPDDPDPALLRVIDRLDKVYEIADDITMARDVITGLMVELADNRQYENQIMPEDIRGIVLTMRKAGAEARVKRAEKRAPAKKRATKKAKSNAELAAAAAELGFSL